MDANSDLRQSKSRRQRKRTKPEYPDDANATERCLMGVLPLELLAEVLSYTAPRDILALARTSKYYCATLVANPASKFIWKKARVRYEPTIPEPTPNFTEPAYAALLFDTGTCEMCGKKTYATYASFTMRLRLCEGVGGPVSCRQSWAASSAHSILVTGYENDRYESILQWIPRKEFSNFGYTRFPNEPLQDAVGILMRKKDWLNAVDEYNKAALSEATMARYIKQKNIVVAQSQTSMKLAKKLIKWRREFAKRRVDASDHNLKLARATATKHGWAVWDLLQSSAFGLLYRSKNKDGERILTSEFELIKSSVAADIAKMTAARKRREGENGYRERRKNVEELYQKLKNAENDNDPLPPLADFRKLSMVQRIQYKPDNVPSTAVARELGKSSLMLHLVNEEIVQWRNNARTALGEILGFNMGTTIGEEKLHPVDRLTARFKCEKCDAHGCLTGWDNLSLDFAAACQHRCKGTKHERAKETWQAGNFVPDPQAIAIVERLLVRLGCADDDVQSIQTVKCLGSRIICLSCPRRIRMDFLTLLRHCYRHEDMQFDVVPEDNSADDMPIEYGLRAKLVAVSSEAERQRRIYICRHCPPPTAAEQANKTLHTARKDPDDSVEAGSDKHSAVWPDVPVETDPTKKDNLKGPLRKQAERVKQRKLRMFSFDGLRSHAKEKHGIEWIDDEDFYRIFSDDKQVTSSSS